MGSKYKRFGGHKGFRSEKDNVIIGEQCLTEFTVEEVSKSVLND